MTTTISNPPTTQPFSQSPPAFSPAAPASEQESSLQDDGLFSPTEIQILVVDDEPNICELIRGALNFPNFFVDTVSQASKIEAQLQAKQYHLVLLDYVIPELNSVTTLDMINQFQPESSLIVISGFPSVDGAVNSLRAKAYDYLTKPFDVSKLQTVVKNCLEARGLLRMSEEALRETLGATIRDRRKELGLTLAQVAERTKISLGYLSQIELGKNSASIETLYRICLGLGIKMTDLFHTVQH